MVIVFQGETGGVERFSISSTIPATSGFVNVVGQNRFVHRFSAPILSGYLLFQKEDVASFQPGHYTLLPEVVDTNLDSYFLSVEDLQVLERPE